MEVERLKFSSSMLPSLKKTRPEFLVKMILPGAVLACLIFFMTSVDAAGVRRLSGIAEQTGSSLTLIQSGPKLIVNDVTTSDSGPVALDLQVNYEEVGGYAFLMFRGVPEEFNFTTGFRVKNSWVVSLRDLDGLQFVPPQGFVGEVDLTVLLVRSKNETVESKKMLVSFGVSEQVANVERNPQDFDELLTSAVPDVSLEEATGLAPAIQTERERLGFDIPTQLQNSCQNSCGEQILQTTIAH